jgi:hypothetical protein
MIWNVVDRRARPFRWRSVTAIVEPASRDNTCPDADQAPLTVDDTVYEERAQISVADAVAWAEALPYPATLYLYDLGHGINVLRDDGTEHYVHCANRFATRP